MKSRGVLITSWMQSVAGDAETVVVGHDLSLISPRIAGACLAATKQRTCGTLIREISLEKIVLRDKC